MPVLKSPCQGRSQDVSLGSLTGLAGHCWPGISLQSPGAILMRERGGFGPDQTHCGDRGRKGMGRSKEKAAFPTPHEYTPSTLLCLLVEDKVVQPDCRADGQCLSD